MAGSISKQAVGVGFGGAHDEQFFIRSVKTLMRAVLEDAMRCYQSGEGGRRRAQAEAWLFDRQADGPFAFETICHVLRIDPGYLRLGLPRWRLQQSNVANLRRLPRRSPVMGETEITSLPRRRRRRAAPYIPSANSVGVAEDQLLACTPALPSPQRRAASSVD